MRKLTIALALSSLLNAGSALAATIEVGKPVPAAKVNGEGEINLDETHEQIKRYSPWSTDALPGRVRTVQAIAGRTSAKKMNQAFIDEVAAAKFDRNKYQTTTIINLSDKIPASGFVVKGKAEASKKEFWWSSVVLDDKGEVARNWGLQPESSAILVLDNQGKVLFFKEGELTQQEREQALNLIKTEIAKSE